MPATTSPQRRLPPWLAVRQLFDMLVDLPAAARAVALQYAAAAPDVHDEVRALLAQHEAEETGAGGFLAEPALLQAAGLGGLTGGHAGQQLGPWQLGQRLGEGGMGEVWAAHRADGAYEAAVAVKLLRTGLATTALLERFQQEQRTLARFDHPHIARLFDAGRTAEGAPYFVLERVNGQRIDEACRGRPLAARLALFLQLADAVAYAHRHLLVHRDLKPANVLVTAEGQVKLLDFGLAQPPQAGGADGRTSHGFTPGCASPEQLRGEALGTATDVYTLGVLLHLLLTGTRPTSPVGHVSQAGQAGQVHDTALALPPAQLRGDLEAIVARALAPRAEDRYPSVDAFAADIRAHQQHLPVAARPATAAYRAGRFVRRHRAAVGVAAVSLGALLVALASLAWQVQKTEAARRDAEARVAEVRQLANRLVFSYHDRIVNLAGALPAREALLADALGYLDGLAKKAPSDALLARELAGTYHRVAVLYGETFSPNLGKLKDAEAAVDKALALLPLYTTQPGLDAAALNEAADIWQTRAQIHGVQGRLQHALAAMQAAQPLVDRASALAPRDLQVRSHQATLAGRQARLLGGSPSQPNLGRLAEARQQWAVALQTFEGMQREQPDEAEWKHQLGWALQGLSTVWLLEGRVDEALPLMDRVVRLRDEAAAGRPDDGHLRFQTHITRGVRATALSFAGRHAEALAAGREALQRLADHQRGDPSNRSAARDTTLARLSLARIHVGAGALTQAQPLLRQVLAELPPAATLAGDFFMRRWRAETQVWLARALLPTEPRAALQQAAEAASLMDGSDDNAARRWLHAQALGEQAQALAALGEQPRAAAVARQAVAAWGSSVPGSLAARAARDRLLAGAR